MSNLAVWKNIKIMMENAGVGGSKCYQFVDFNKPELMSHLALHLLHSISPSSQVEITFKTEEKDLVTRSSLYNKVFGKAGVAWNK